MKKTKRHQWKYPRANYGLPREGTPACCTRCPAKHWYQERPKKQPYTVWVYGPNTEDLIYEARPGAIPTVGPKPMPSCVP